MLRFSPRNLCMTTLGAVREINPPSFSVSGQNVLHTLVVFSFNLSLHFRRSFYAPAKYSDLARDLMMQVLRTGILQCHNKIDYQ